jgi:hypothetical protein
VHFESSQLLQGEAKKEPKTSIVTKHYKFILWHAQKRSNHTTQVLLSCFLDLSPNTTPVITLLYLTPSTPPYTPHLNQLTPSCSFLIADL